jgi:hypothetical protein
VYQVEVTAGYSPDQMILFCIYIVIAVDIQLFQSPTSNARCSGCSWWKSAVSQREKRGDSAGTSARDHD